MKAFDKNSWIGRVFKCTATGEIFVIPTNVRAKDFFTFGECFIDVGDGYYARFGGNPIEIT